jgi:hypothetical protein
VKRVAWMSREKSLQVLKPVSFLVVNENSSTAWRMSGCVGNKRKAIAKIGAVDTTDNLLNYSKFF